MPVIIVGMHRSGTSMVTRLLYLCGLYLGEERDRMLPIPEDNPEGYWEHAPLVSLDTEMLEHLGGSWYKPPALQPGWSQDESLNAFWDRFAEITSNFHEHGLWGWKDPRNSLLLEFWLTRIPDLKIVLCLRNPLEVAESLSTGKPMRELRRADALQLWTTYYEAILQQVAPERLLVTHYESYFYDPEAELRRVAGALELPASDADIAAAVDTIKLPLKRQYMPEAYLIDDPDVTTARELYESLCARAGETFQRLRADADYTQKATLQHARNMYWHNTQLEALLSSERVVLQESLQRHEQLQATLQDRQRRIGDLEQSLAERDRQADQLRQLLGDRDRQIDQQRAALAALEPQIQRLAALQAAMPTLRIVALQGYFYRRLNLSRAFRLFSKMRNYWSIRRVTRAVRSGRLTVPALFDAAWYLDRYPEVREAGMHPYVHFWLFGWYQEYRPMPLFDTGWYATTYPSFNDAWANPLEHYEQTGQFSGCRPNPYFDPQWYVSQNPDVKQAGIDPLLHYHSSGAKEGRRPSREFDSVPA